MERAYLFEANHVRVEIREIINPEDKSNRSFSIRCSEKNNVNYWINHYVYFEDRNGLREFAQIIHDFCVDKAIITD